MIYFSLFFESGGQSTGVSAFRRPVGKDPDAGEDSRREEKGETGWDSWMASPTRWTWVWASSGSWWWTGKPGMLQSVGSQSQTWLSDWRELQFMTLDFYLFHLWLRENFCVSILGNDLACFSTIISSYFLWSLWKLLSLGCSTSWINLLIFLFLLSPPTPTYLFILLPGKLSCLYCKVLF